MVTENTHSDIDELIIAYFSEGLKQDDADKLAQWVNASAENRKYFSDKQEVWLATLDANASERFNKDEAYHRFVTRTKKALRPVKAKRKSFPLQRIWYGAAVVAMLVSVSVISYWQGGEKLKTRFTDIVVEAPLGSQTKMYLPDGTLVWLNAGSRITYSQGFGVNERNIRLSGEGYFEVVKNEELAFAVITDELTVNVLGTKFNFSNYSEEEEASVSLLEGKVMARNNIREDNNINMKPNQKLFLNKRTGEMRVSVIEAKRSTELTNGNLFFDEDILPDIIKELERNYDVHITLADDSLKTFRFYGSFIKRDCRIEDILDMLASTGKIKYKVIGKQIELSAK